LNEWREQVGANERAVGSMKNYEIYGGKIEVLRKKREK